MTAKATRRTAEIVPMRPAKGAKETTADIIADVQGRRLREERELLQQIKDVTAVFEDRHRERVKSLLPIGYAMQGQTLLEFIEIGQRMLAARGGRR